MRNLILLLSFLTLVLSCKGPEARRPVQSNSGSFIKESVKRNKVLYKKEETIIAKIINDNPDIDYKASTSGFWYHYNKKDTLQSIMPKYGDLVTFTYNIKDLKGTTIVTEAENGLQRYQIDKTNQDLISGIRDGLKLMKEGETVTFLFPSHKAYGYYGIIEKIGANVPIQSTVTLKSIETTEN